MSVAWFFTELQKQETSVGRKSDALENLPGKDENICVVSIIGKSPLNAHRSKAGIFNSIVDAEVFNGTCHDERNCGTKNMCNIEVDHDLVNHVVYLHLVSAHDTAAVTSMCHRAADDIAKNGYHAFWRKAEYTYARSLLFLFSVSHIVVLVQPGGSFDMSCVRLFRILNTARGNLQPSVSNILQDVEVSKNWQLAGRPCSPRVLFVFEQCVMDCSMLDSEISKTRAQKMHPIQKLQHAMEDHIYRILRKSHIITNISNNSLFAVPANQEFVYICEQKAASHDPVDFFLTQLHINCTVNDADCGNSSSHLTNDQRSNGLTCPRTAQSSTDHTTLKQFLFKHINMAHSKGFDDNVGRNPVPAVFELPSTDVWLQVCQKLYTFFLLDPPYPQAHSHFNTLKLQLEVNNRFSEGRCAKVLPLAENAYQEGLPAHYTKSYHLTKLSQAKQVFSQHARGPACDKYLQQLAEDCEKIWQSGRQLCEAISLTGNHCVNELHRLSEDHPVTETTEHLPVLQHCSQLKVKSTCNCGRKQSDRDDPFDLKTANFNFYEKLELICCGRLDHHTFPVFSTSGVEHRTKESDVRESGLVKKEGGLEGKDSSASSGQLHQGQEKVKGDSQKLDLVQGVSSLSLALSLGHSGGSDSFGHDLHASPNPEGSQTAPEPVVVLPQIVTQPSTTEYLPGMLHSDSPRGLLPQFSSWSLISLGKYTNYSIPHGLDQPGFLHSGNHLLVWEVVVKGDRERWPTISETSGKKSKFKKPTKSSAESPPEVTLRLYLGMEYECPRGHRFFCNGPDKVYKSHTPGSIKETAHKLLNSDMPLYFPCHCRSSKGGYMGQLMRIFISIPEGPLKVELDPHVVPGPQPCPVFYPTSEGAVTLQPGCLWVLRLPYVYLGEEGPYVMPSDPQLLAACRLLAGVFKITCTQQ